MSAAAPPRHEERANERHAQARDEGALDTQHCALSPRTVEPKAGKPRPNLQTGSTCRARITPETESRSDGHRGRPRVPKRRSRATERHFRSTTRARKAPRRERRRDHDDTRKSRPRGHPARRTRSARGDTKPPNSRISRTVRTLYRATVAPPIEPTDEILKQPSDGQVSARARRAVITPARHGNGKTHGGAPPAVHRGNPSRGVELDRRPVEGEWATPERAQTRPPRPPTAGGADEPASAEPGGTDDETTDDAPPCRRHERAGSGDHELAHRGARDQIGHTRRQTRNRSPTCASVGWRPATARPATTTKTPATQLNARTTRTWRTCSCYSSGRPTASVHGNRSTSPARIRRCTPAGRIKK